MTVSVGSDPSKDFYKQGTYECENTPLSHYEIRSDDLTFPAVHALESVV